MKATKKTGGPRFVAASIGRAALVATAFCVATAPSPSFADTVTADAAKTAVAGWVNLRQSMDGGAFSAPESAKAYSGADGKGTYYVVSLSGGGYVVTSGDTFLKPVLSYASSGAWEENEAKNPLALFVKCDVAASAAAMPVAGSAVASANAAEWAKLAAAASQKSGSRRLAATAPTADLRVSPLLTTAWAQGSVDGKLCYNYYTPGNYVCGCVATALAQVMKYFRYPTGKVTAGEWYYDSVNYNGTDKGYDLDGYFASATATTKTPWSPAFGGPYNWDAMVDAPTGSTSETARKAIGQLCRDAAITVFSHFNVNNGGETSGYSGTQASALVKTFGFAGATASPYNENALLASLDAGLPAVMELSGNGGHGVVADGYGYDDGGTLYVHFNFGWGDDNSGRWYTPPSVAAFTSISRMIAAIFTPAQGTRGSSVISGRVLDANGSPVSGATVTAKNAAGAVVATKTSNAKGIYAFILPAGVYRLAAESGSNKSERLCTVESTESPLRPNDGWGGENTVNHSRSGIDLAFGQTTGLMHRWSFNGTTDEENLTDSVGGVVAKKMQKTGNSTTVEGGTVNWTNGKATLPGGTGTGFLNLGEGVLGTGKAATLEAWVTRNAKNTAWGYIISYSILDSTANLLTVSPASGSDITRSCVEWSGSGQKNDVLVGQPIGVTYHYAITFDGSRTRIMVRNAETGFLLREYSLERSGWSLASAASDGCALTLGNNPFTNGRYDVPYSFDEVRVWNGVLCDDQLTASVLAGPDNVVGGEQEAFAIDAGATFTVPATVGGYGFMTDKIALLGSGSKIRFDTTDYFGTGLRFKAGGFAIPSGSVLDYVELSDPENYTATMEDANTILVRFKPTIPYESTWSGGTPATAADLANAAKWTSVNAAGETISAAPGAKTTVIIPAASLAAFAIPSGTTLNWGRVLLGGRTKAKYGFKDGVPDNATTTWRDLALSGYTTVSDIPNGKNDISYLTKSSGNLPSECGTAQIRLDGWFYVRSDQAGKWTLPNKFDDLGAFAIDGVWLYILNTYRVDSNGGTFVSEGWHRYTIVVGDTSGNWGSSLSLNGASVPFAVSINGGSNIAFSDANFTFGSDTDTVALSGDADWRALGAITLDSGLTIDLNGHNLRFASITATSVGARLTNSSATTSSLLGDFDADNLIVDGNIFLRAAELTHRWSFNGLTDEGNLVDSVGNVVATKDSSLISWNGTSMVMAGNGSEGSYGLVLGRGLLDAKAATIEIWATQHEIRNWNALFEYAVDTTDNVRWRLNYGTRDYQQSICAPGVDVAAQFRNTLDEPAHFSVTFAENGAGTFVRFMRRHAKTGAIEYECSGTTTKSIADFDNPYFIVGGTMWKDKTANAEFDEIRLWKGVLSDAQLAASVLAGPNTVLGDGAAPAGETDRLVLASGDVFDVPTTGGGYGFWTDKKVVLNNGAKIRFTTADYFGTGLRFRTGGFVMASGATDPRTFVELDDTTNYNLEMEDENTILVRLKDALPHTSTWIGGVPSSASDFANASKWTSVNAKGETVSAAPCAKTTVIIPAASLAAFTMPSGATATWGRTILGGYSAVRYGYKDGSPASVRNAWRDLALSSYTTIGEVPGGADGIELFTGGGNTPADLATAQMRLDGWFYVTAAQAGFWSMPNKFDDVLSFAIDGEWVLLNSTYRFTNGAGAYVSEGWHRFTLAAGETGGGWGSAYSINGVNVPFVVSINGGANIRFSPDNFTFGSDATSVTLSGNADWTGLGPVFMENGLVVDLDGHSLSVAGLDGNFVSATFKNTSATASTLTTYSGAVGTGVITDNITISSTPPATATWTGAGGTGLANDHRNWNCYDSSSVLLPGALPIASTTVTMNNDPVANVNDGMTLAWGASTLGTGANGGLYQDGGSLTVNGEFHLGYTANKTSTCTFKGGSFTSTSTLKMCGAATTKGVLNIDGGNVTVKNISVPSYSGGNAEINVDSGTLKVPEWVDFGNYGTSTWNQRGGDITVAGNLWLGKGNGVKVYYNMTGGTLSNTGGSRLSLGETGGSTIYFTLDDGVVTFKKPLILNYNNSTTYLTINGGTLTGTDYFAAGRTGTCYVKQNGGLVTTTSYLSIGSANNTRTHNYEMNGGTISVLNSDFNVGDNGKGTMTLNGGTVNVKNVKIGSNNQSNCSGNLDMRGGTLNVSSNNTYVADSYALIIGRYKPGTFTLGGGTVNAYSGVTLAHFSTGTGTLTVTGGVLNTTFIRKGDGTANTVTFKGGKIVALNATETGATFFDGLTAFAFGKGGLTFDTAGYDVTLSSGTLTSTESGSLLRKEGAGTFTMHALPPVDDIYVDAGSLALSATVDNTGSATRSLAIASGATLALGGNALTQPVIAGAGTVQNGTLTVTKKIRVNADEKLTFSGVALDVTGTTVEVADPENLTQPFVFAESTTAITGMPSSGVRGWKVKKSADGMTLTFKRVRGAMVIVD